MTLPLEDSLVELRQEVMTRVGMNASGRLGQQTTPLIDSMLNQSQREIYTRAYWARQQRKLAFPLQTGVIDYDIPERTTIGGIHRITVQNKAAPPHEYELRYEDALETQDYLAIKNTRPMYFQVIDDGLRIVPMADVSVYPQFFIYCELAPTRMRAETDRPVVDSEALVQSAVLKLKKYLGVGGDLKLETAQFGQYLTDLRGLVAPSRSYPIASRKIDGPIYWKSPSVNAYSTPYAPDWNPGDGLW